MGIWLMVFALWLTGAIAQQNVTISRMQLSLEETHELLVDTSIEFILDFNPNEEQARWPLRVWVESDGGHPSRPLLITYRQRMGAGAWQLPWTSGSQLQYQLERTLCIDDRSTTEPPECESEYESPGWVSLHVVSGCRQRVRLRVTPARDWLIAFEQPLHTTATLTAPRVHGFEWGTEQQRVRLTVSSTHDVCATVAVQPPACPIAETLDDLSAVTIRMTVQRSGAIQLSRERFPRGFLVVAVVHDSDAACADEERAAADWLWADVFYGDEDQELPPPRVKDFEFHTTAALSRAQYAIAAVATLGVFLAFYLAFGLLVLAQRWPPFAKLVAPKAVLAADAETTMQSQTDTARNDSRRRDSTATFDSSDISDSDESDAEAERTSRPTPPIPDSRFTNPPTPATPATVRAETHTPDPKRYHSPDTLTSDTRTPDTVDNIPSPEDRSSVGSPQTDGDRGLSYTDVAEQNSRTEANGIQNGGEVRPSSGETRPDSRGVGPSSREAGPNNREVGPSSREVGPSSSGVGASTRGVGPSGDSGVHPWGLPAQLRVAALSRRRARVLRARADRYLATLLTVAVFYALPVLQFVFTFQIFLNVSGSLDICYYNFLCAHPAGLLSDFNHVFSNLGYLLLGALFILQLHRRRRARDRHPRHEDYGIPAHYGLLVALGAGMMVVALLSASYHVCPNRLNFQFDTSFMYVLAVLSMVKIYQSRHPDVNARAHATFGVLAVLIALVVWGVLGGGALFWGVFTVIRVFTFLLLSLRIYYLGQFRFEKDMLQRAARQLRANPGEGLRPLYTARLVMLLIANSVNWALALYGLFNQSADFASHLLYVLLGNTLLYMTFYLVMKLLHGERPRWYAWAYTAGAVACWVPALFFFTWGSSSWSSSAARSRHLNHECLALRFYDAHDLWHMLSAAALYLSFNAMLTWDDGLAAVPRTEIAVF